LIGECGDFVALVHHLTGENCTVTYRANGRIQTDYNSPVSLQSAADIEISIHCRSKVLKKLINLTGKCKL